MERVPQRRIAPAPQPGGLERFSRAIERDIVPRLLEAHRAGPYPPGMLMAAADLRAAETTLNQHRHQR